MQINIIARVKELMKEEGLDYKNEILVLNIAIIYVRAQQDSLMEIRK